MQFWQDENPPAAGAVLAEAVRAANHRKESCSRPAGERGKRARRVQFAANDFSDIEAWKGDEVLEGRGTIERRHSRHRLPHTSSSRTTDAEGAV